MAEATPAGALMASGDLIKMAAMGPYEVQNPSPELPSTERELGPAQFGLPRARLWGSKTPSSSISDLSAACSSFWPQGPSPKSCSNACSNPGGTHRHVAAPGGLKPRTP